jgi:hypothetical protein
MANRDKLKELLNKREIVTPINLYTKPQVDKTTKPQVVKNTKPQVHKEAKPQVVKYTTHLKAETIKDIKRYSLENDLKDYEVLQEAVENYLKGKRPPKVAF